MLQGLVIIYVCSCTAFFQPIIRWDVLLPRIKQDVNYSNTKNSIWKDSLLFWADLSHLGCILISKYALTPITNLLSESCAPSLLDEALIRWISTDEYPFLCYKTHKLKPSEIINNLVPRQKLRSKIQNQIIHLSKCSTKSSHPFAPNLKHRLPKKAGNYSSSLQRLIP